MNLLKKINPKKLAPLVVLLVVIIAGLVYFFYPRESFVCPNDEKTVEAYIESTAKWMRNEMDKNPNITETELLESAQKRLEEHNCEISKWFKDAIENPPNQLKSHLGFSFIVPSGFAPDTNIVDSNKIILLSKDDPTVQIIITASTENTTMTPKEWFLSSSSEKDRSEGYTETEVDGQPAVGVHYELKGLVNTPDNKYRLEFAAIPGNGEKMPVYPFMDLLGSVKFDRK